MLTTLDPQTGDSRAELERHRWPPPWPAAAVNRPITVMSTWSCRSPTPSDVQGTAAGTARPGGRTTARRRQRRPRPTAAAPIKAEGWGTLKGQVVFGGDSPGRQGPPGEGQGGEGPRSLRRR